MRYSRLALFPPSTRATLKLFGDVFAKSCYSCRCKWDGTLGTASAYFQVIRQPRNHSILRGRRICHQKEKIVDLKRKHKVVLKSFSKRTLPFIRLSQTNWWILFSRKQRWHFWERKCQQKNLSGRFRCVFFPPSSFSKSTVPSSEHLIFHLRVSLTKNKTPEP